MRLKKMKYSRLNPTAWPVALGLLVIVLTGCASGTDTSKIVRIKPGAEFLEQLISEQDTIVKCCPATGSVVDDWITQNEPEDL